MATTVFEVPMKPIYDWYAERLGIESRNLSRWDAFDAFFKSLPADFDSSIGVFRLGSGFLDRWSLSSGSLRCRFSAVIVCDELKVKFLFDATEENNDGLSVPGERLKCRADGPEKLLPKAISGVRNYLQNPHLLKAAKIFG